MSYSQALKRSMEKSILTIAKRHLLIETLETRKSDSLDFYDVAVWNIRDSLEAAYIAGLKNHEGVNRKLLDALDYLLKQTVDMDMKHGIGLSEGEADARWKALDAIAEATPHAA